MPPDYRDVERQMEVQADPLDPLNISVEKLTRRLLAAEQANAELRRFARATGEGAWKSPLILLLLLISLLLGGVIGHWASTHQKPPVEERIE
jgi:hypothetical protein